jgi:chemotaxis protein CheZ
MECAEAVLAADARDPAFKAMVDENVLSVFEACSFQDITGQRVAKVIETLKHIEAGAARFNDALRVRDASGFVSEAERASAERKERLLLDGPQLDGNDRQSEVDRLMEL